MRGGFHTVTNATIFAEGGKVINVRTITSTGLQDRENSRRHGRGTRRCGTMGCTADVVSVRSTSVSNGEDYKRSRRRPSTIARGLM